MAQADLCRSKSWHILIDFNQPYQAYIKSFMYCNHCALGVPAVKSTPLWAENTGTYS